MDKPEKATFGILRNGEALSLPLIILYNDTGADLGIAYSSLEHIVRSDSIAKAIPDGVSETWKMFTVEVQGLGLLFRGVNILKAISGPARITYLIGTTTKDSFTQNGAGGLIVVINFLAFLSIALFLMNLLPIPALDGGMIIIFLVEAIRRLPLKTKTIYRYQIIGMVFILSLFALAAFSDLLYFSGK